MPESCGVRTAVCLKASVTGWELGLVLTNSCLCGFACDVNPRGMFILSNFEKRSLMMSLAQALVNGCFSLGLS